MADSFLSFVAHEETGPALANGSRVAVIGGGPAGSFFSFFLLRLAKAVDLDVHVEMYEPRSFTRCGPAGCNHCGGIVSENLIQIMAAEGMHLPPSVVQCGIESYVVHTDAGSVRIESPAGERRIAALSRGSGPRGSMDNRSESFDLHLQQMAIDQGARMRRSLITDIQWRDGVPWLIEPDGSATKYDLVTVATGVNSNFLRMLSHLRIEIQPPNTTRAYVCEYRAAPEEIRRVLGSSMHVFLLAVPRLKFAAIIPKGEFVTVCMLGDRLDHELVHDVLSAPIVRRCLPADVTRCVCSCSPLMNIGARMLPYADRLVFVGDSGVTRLYKDGIGAALRTAKAAAATAVFHGVSAKAFEKHFWPACRLIAHDNAFGNVIFRAAAALKHSRTAQRAVIRMTSTEQAGNGDRRMSSVLWNTFTGSAPYREIFRGALHPAFVTRLLLNIGFNMWPARRKD